MMIRKAVLSAAALLSLVFLFGCGGEKPAQQNSKTDPLAEGREVFQTRCTFCHGFAADGKTPTAMNYPNANLADGKFAHGGTHDEIVRTVTNGVPGTPMPHFGGLLADDEISSVADYVQSIAHQPNAASAAIPQPIKSH